MAESLMKKSSSGSNSSSLSGMTWTKEHQVGEGCFGRVFVGRLEDGTQIAAKQVPLQATSSEHLSDIARRVAKEIAILEAVTGSHRNIVRYYGWSLSTRSKSIYFLMQYIKGPTLQTCVMEKLNRSMTEDEIRVITRQLLSALVFVHSKGVVHKDVKPDNVLIRSSDNVVKLIDFGIAGICGHRREAIGPPLYSAPEILDTRLPQSTKCDSFSLGLTVYFMATKSHPLIDSMHEAVLALMPTVVHDKMVSLREPLPGLDPFKFSRRLCNFYQASTAKNPRDRATCSQLLCNSDFMRRGSEPQDIMIVSGCRVQ